MCKIFQVIVEAMFDMWIGYFVHRCQKDRKYVHFPENLSFFVDIYTLAREFR